MKSFLRYLLIDVTIVLAGVGFFVLAILLGSGLAQFTSLAPYLTR